MRAGAEAGGARAFPAGYGRIPAAAAGRRAERAGRFPSGVYRRAYPRRTDGDNLLRAERRFCAG